MNTQLTVIIAVAAALVPLIKQLIDLTKALKDLLQTQESEQKKEARQQANKQAQHLIVWLVAIFGTLIVPTGAIIFFFTTFISQYLAPVTTDIGLFVLQLSTTVAAISALYPLAWGIYIYPIICDYLAKRSE